MKRASKLHIVGLMCVVLAVACGGTGAAPPPKDHIAFRYSFQTGTPSASLQLLAKADGYFDAEKMDVEMLPTTGATGTLVAAISANSIDGAMVAISTSVTTRQSGVRVKLLPGFIPSPRVMTVPSKDTTAPVAKKGNFAATLKAVAGKPVGVAGITGAPAKELTALGKQAGLGDQPFAYVDVESGAPTVAALKTATVAATYGTAIGAQQAVSGGYGRIVMTSSDVSADYNASIQIGTMVRDDFISQHPDFGARWQRAVTKAVKEFNDKSQRRHVIDVLQKNGVSFTGVDASQLLDLTPTTVTLQNSDLKKAVDFMYSAGVVPKKEPLFGPADVVAPEGRS